MNTSPDNSATVDPIHTACRDCIFARYEGTTQVGCNFNNRLDKFRDQGSVVEAKDEKFEFSVVNKRYCSAYRTDNYLTKLEIPSGFTPVDIVRKEITARIDYIVVVNESTTVEQLDLSMRSISRQTLKSNVVAIASNQNKWKSFKLPHMMDKICERLNLNWYVVNLIRRNEDGSLLPDSVAVDEAFPKCSGHLYVRLNAGTTVPRRLGEFVDKYLTDELGQFSVLEATEQMPVEVVHSAFHHFVKGNEPIQVAVPGESERKWISTLPEKAKFYEDAGNTVGMLRKVTEVCK